MQPDLEVKFPEQSISEQKVRFLDLGTEIHPSERASRIRPPQNQPVYQISLTSYIKFYWLKENFHRRL